MKTEYVITTNSLCKHYKSFKALDGLDLHVPKGSIYGLIGRNGSGKTTFMRLLCGLQTPTSGSFSLYGTENTSKDICSARRRMGAVVETPSIYLEMSAYDNLKQQCLIIGTPDFDMIPEILKLVGLENTGKKRAKNFSLGMRQRLGIAVALVGNPDLLILDEPINGLDPQGIVEIRELILTLNRERGVTVLISSHILDELHKLATHFGFVDKGRIIKEMTAEELENACKKCTEIEVDSIEKLTVVLDGMDVSYEIISDKTARYFADIPATELILALKEGNCSVVSMNEKNESLESFYMNLTGGKEND